MKSKGTILIIEDDADISESLSVALSFEGYETKNAPNGLEALNLLHRPGNLPNLILLDITMPVMGGAEFLAEQKKEATLAAVPVILMSAARDRVRQGILLEVAAHLRKPMDLSELSDLVERFALPEPEASLQRQEA